jgi:IS30 family transposase
VHTITSDNGKEFAKHESVAEKLNAGYYFARPYHSRERGVNKNYKRLLRQYFPKKHLLMTKPMSILKRFSTNSIIEKGNDKVFFLLFYIFKFYY